MGMARTLIFDGSKPHFGDFLKGFMLTNLFFSPNSIWVFLWSCIVHLFSFIFKNFSSSSGEDHGEIAPDFGEVCEKSDVAHVGLVESAKEEVGFDQIEERETPKIDTEVGCVSNASTSKYQFISGNSLCAFIEGPETMSFTVQEMFVISNDDGPLSKKEFVQDHPPPQNDSMGLYVDFIDSPLSHDVVLVSNLSEKTEAYELDGEDEDETQGKTELSVCDFSQELETLSFSEHEFHERREIANGEDGVPEEHKGFDQVHPSVKYSDDFWASIHKFDEFSYTDHEFDANSGEMLCDKSISEALSPETPMGVGDKRVNFEEDSPRSSDGVPSDQSSSSLGDVSIGSEAEDADAQYVELDIQPRNSITNDEDHIPSDEFSDSESELDEESSAFDDPKGIDSSESCEGEDDQNGMDVLLEQKELIRQMKKEMRHLKISGLPTILEESESPRVEDDLRPLKIDERIGHKDRMDEIQILYKRYLDKMRKLDILSQQTMYAIGLLQLKGQDQSSASNKRVSVSAIKSLLSQNLGSNKFRRHEAHDPVQKLIRDFQRDFELVYVGQLCLSWEILKWLHHKAELLHANDPEGFRQHNQVAGEFQKFQVLLQRFTEDEPFHNAPRVQLYVKTRCRLPSLLQVPLIKDDPRSEWRGKGEGRISVGMLKDVIGASMRAFWDFLKADKDESHSHATTLIGIHGHHVHLEDPSDTELLTEIRANLQKKEKRLKDLIRSGNCIVKKFQKHQDHRLSREMFLAQVELRLVSRALSMARLSTDQLLWCHKKVSKINVVGRKIYLEDSFLLFPC